MHIYVKYICLKAKTISLRVFKIIDFNNMEYEVTKGTLYVCKVKVLSNYKISCKASESHKKAVKKIYPNTH